ncbi:hypothetical protein MKZ38_004918 [Zalerion maritima]|uniref:PH domain-containing protein n=1 Tax=Zalerion maritima TaxID=339359 RepID=A0AAD5WXB2_9PEZI|nr:hypothetical protein MKZ38_004918 [Zalerion maritima]
MSEAPNRQSTMASEDAVPDIDPSSTAGLLAERLQAYKHAVAYLEDYMDAFEKVHKHQAKEYEKVLKTISNPLREGHHFVQNLGGVAGLFENLRSNTQALVNTNLETEKSIKGTVLPILERLHKEIKAKAKELSQGAGKAAKEVEKARNTTQKHIELLGQHTAAFESTGGKMSPGDDPYMIQRGVLHRLSKQVLEENNYREDLIAVQQNFQQFEEHVIKTVQQSMESFNSHVGGQAEKTRQLIADMTSTAQRVPTDAEWKAFVEKSQDILVDPNEPARFVDQIAFPNQDHPSTKPLMEGSLERKSRNKLSWGYSTGYYVVTPSKFLHEFKDTDNDRKDPQPELSIYLPDATLGAPKADKFEVKGKDRSKKMSSKLTGTSDLHFKAHSADDAQKWFEAVKSAAEGAPVQSTPASPISPSSPVDPAATSTSLSAAATPDTDENKPDKDHKPQEVGLTGGSEAVSPASDSKAAEAAAASEPAGPSKTDTPPEEKKPA